MDLKILQQKLSVGHSGFVLSNMPIDSQQNPDRTYRNRCLWMKHKPKQTGAGGAALWKSVQPAHTRPLHNPQHHETNKIKQTNYGNKIMRPKGFLQILNNHMSS